ncbi:hypothetical protein [Granulosicoccus antarcticus]|nr:hypothetical protein [Granulosicoccus antarcticus]
MSIDLNNLQLKLGSTDVVLSMDSIITFLNDVTDYYAQRLTKKQNCDYVSAQHIRRKSAMKSTESKNVLCSLRHAFTSFSEYSIEDLFIYQENQDWYPKIVLTQHIDTADLSGHPAVLRVYRGCDEHELNQHSFGQSWSLNKSVAHEFAYVHYSSQPWFESVTRIVIEAKILKADVYFARLDHHENEVTVNTAKLYDVK